MGQGFLRGKQSKSAWRAPLNDTKCRDAGLVEVAVEPKHLFALGNIEVLPRGWIVIVWLEIIQLGSTVISGDHRWLVKRVSNFRLIYLYFLWFGSLVVHNPLRPFRLMPLHEDGLKSVQLPRIRLRHLKSQQND